MSIQRTAKGVALPAYNKVLAYFGELKAANYDISNTIVLSSFPRSGSTWVAEVLSTIPESCIMWEPLNPGDYPGMAGYKKVPALQALRLDEYPVIRPNSGVDWTPFETFVERVLSGELLSRYTLSHAIAHTGWRTIIGSKRWIIKFCRANGILHWMTQRFPVRPIVLIRHPCAVVASRVSNPDWAHLDIDTLTTMWCRNHHALLSFPGSHRWIITTYEGLVTNGEKELHRIFDWLETQMPQEAVARLDIASASTTQDSFVAQGKDPLTGWTYRLKKKEIHRVLTMVESFGLDFYSEELEPDYDRLYDLTNR